MTESEPVAIRAIAAGGDGVGTLPDGRTVFVPRSAPGDQVTLRKLRMHQRFARGEVDRVVVSGPGRIDPPCPHYVGDQCGGCQLMHLHPAAQRAAKGRIVGDALRRIGRVDIADPEVVPASADLGYRAKVTLAVRDGVVGLHRRGEAGRIFELRRCLLLEPEIDALHQQLRAARGRLPRDASHVVLRRDAKGGRHVIVRTGGTAAWNGAAGLAAAIDPGVVVWWQPEGGAARALAGSDDPWPAAVFEQVNPAVGAMVREHAVAELTRFETRDSRLESGSNGSLESRISNRESRFLAWDLYAGIGEATAMLAAQGMRVQSIELDPRAVALAERLGPAGPQRHAGDVAGTLRRLDPPDLVLTNPPRTGMDEPVTRVLAESGAARIVYVSCDPGTLARDLRRLEGRYRLAAVAAFDQFPQTAHVECVATLERQ